MSDPCQSYPTNAALHREHLQLLADHRETMTRLRDLRDEYRAFKAQAGANLACLNELAAELLERFPGTGVSVGALRAMTWHLGQQFRGEAAPYGFEPDAEYVRLAGETEADKPGSCPVEAVFPDCRLPCLLPRGHDGGHQHISGTSPKEPWF